MISDYHDRDLFTPEQARQECWKCPGPCAIGCRWFWLTHTNAQRITALRKEASEAGEKELHERYDEMAIA